MTPTRLFTVTTSLDGITRTWHVTACYPHTAIARALQYAGCNRLQGDVRVLCELVASTAPPAAVGAATARAR